MMMNDQPQVLREQMASSASGANEYAASAIAVEQSAAERRRAADFPVIAVEAGGGILTNKIRFDADWLS